MRLSPAIYGEVKDGRFIAEDPNLFRFAFLCHEGRKVRVEVVRDHKTRSHNQNRYYWGVVVALIADAMGEENLIVAHETLKTECNSELRIWQGREYRAPKSTADLDTAAFEEYLERCRKFSAEFFGVYIPLPNEVVSA